ncbi:acyltransferase family protein [Actinoplanes sp. NPDC051633]|uniref:acyltransferase n=1 Tax=Actinoplanes sp. NPDC051633 TaxID=3155670 RepID=UPI003435E97D
MTDTTLSVVGIPAQHAAAPSAPTRAEPRPARQWELDALRLAAIAGVVAIHVFGLMIGKLVGSRGWWAAVVLDVGSTWVVPVFVMISGALVLSPRAHADGPVAFYRKRFVRILPALVVWHLVYLLVVRAAMRGQDLSWGTVTANLINAKTYTALYFLFLIAGLYVLAPVLAAFLGGGGRRRAYLLAAVAMVWTQGAYAVATLSGKLGQPHPLPLDAWNQWWPYVGLFLAGWALRKTVLSVPGMVVAFMLGTAAMAEAVWQFGHPTALGPLAAFVPVTRLGPVVAVAALCFFLVAVGVGARVTPSPRVTLVLKRLSDASFGVFLVHLLILEIGRLTIPAVAAASSFWVLLPTYVATLLVSFLVSLVAARIPYVRAVF